VAFQNLCVTWSLKKIVADYLVFFCTLVDASVGVKEKLPTCLLACCGSLVE
jgi:hypothetical protein